MHLVYIYFGGESLAPQVCATTSDMRESRPTFPFSSGTDPSRHNTLFRHTFNTKSCSCNVFVRTPLLPGFKNKFSCHCSQTDSAVRTTSSVSHMPSPPYGTSSLTFPLFCRRHPALFCIHEWAMDFTSPSQRRQIKKRTTKKI